MEKPVKYILYLKPTVPVGLIVAQGSDALPQNEQGVVYVPCLLQPLSKRLGFVASFRASQVTQRKPGRCSLVSYFLYKWSFPGAGATVGQQSCPVLILSLDNYLTNYE